MGRVTLVFDDLTAEQPLKYINKTLVLKGEA